MRQLVKPSSPIPPRASAAYAGIVTRQVDTEIPVQMQEGRVRDSHWLTPIGCGGVIVFFCVALWTWWVVPTYTNLLMQWHYGDAHVTRLSADIGRGSEDFLAYDANGHVVVLEVNTTHPEKTHIYTGIGLLNDRGDTLITLSLADVNHDGKTDLIVTVEQEHYVLFNKGDSFSWSEK